MKPLLLVGIGSFAGGVFRYLLSRLIESRHSSVFPFGTLLVNVLGCLAIGLIVGLAERWKVPDEWRLFLATGLCGGFTTFSAFSLETVRLMGSGRFVPALLYVTTSVVLGLLATFLGMALVKNA